MNGTLSVSPSFVKDVFAMMNKNIQFNYSEDYKARMHELVADYLSEYCYKMDDYYLKKAEETLCEEMYYSFACPEYLALQCAVNYRLSKFDDVNYWIELIEKHYKEMLKTSSNSMLLYLLIKSEVQIDNNKFSVALETLKEAKEHASSCVMGVIELFTGIAKLYLSNYLPALENFQNAEKILLEYRVYGRTLAASKNIASCYSYLHFNEKAKDQFNKVLKEAKRIRRRDIEDMCYINLSNIHFKQGDYLSAIEHGKHVVDESDCIHYIAMAWSYFFLEDYNMCKKCRNKLKEFDDYYLSMMVELIDLYLAGSDSNLKINVLKRMIAFSEANECQNDVMWCTRFLINEYRIQENYQKVAEYQAFVLKRLGYQSFI